MGEKKIHRGKCSLLSRFHKNQPTSERERERKNECGSAFFPPPRTRIQMNKSNERPAWVLWLQNLPSPMPSTHPVCLHATDRLDRTHKRRAGGRERKNSSRVCRAEMQLPWQEGFRDATKETPALESLLVPIESESIGAHPAVGAAVVKETVDERAGSAPA